MFTFKTSFMMNHPAGRATYCQSKARCSLSIFKKSHPTSRWAAQYLHYFKTIGQGEGRAIFQRKPRDPIRTRRQLQMSTDVKEMKTSLLMTTEAANCTSSSSRRERKGASDGKWVECRLKSFIGAAKESEGVSEGEPRDIAMLFWLHSDGALNLTLCWWWRCSARETGELTAGHRS